MTPLLSMLAGARAFGFGVFKGLFEPSGAVDALATVTVPAGGATSITFSGIPAGYMHLQIRALARNTGGTYNDIRIGFNGDTGTSYSWHRLIADGATVSAGSSGSTTLSTVGIYTGSSQTAGIFGVNIMDILDYASTTKNKTIRSIVGADGNGSGYAILYDGAWYNTAAINTINFTPLSGSFAENTQFELYGVK